MSSTNFGKILNTAICQIRNSLAQKYQIAVIKAKEEFTNAGEQRKIKNKIKSLEKEIEVLQKELDAFDPYVTYEQKEKLMAEHPELSIGAYTRLSDVNKQLTVDVLPVCTNQYEFENIAKRFGSMINLAVGGKEQRNILFQFYTLDWKSLGIDVPCDLDISNIEIKDGVIVSDTVKQLK